MDKGCACLPRVAMPENTGWTEQLFSNDCVLSLIPFLNRNCVFIERQGTKNVRLTARQRLDLLAFWGHQLALAPHSSSSIFILELHQAISVCQGHFHVEIS